MNVIKLISKGQRFPDANETILNKGGSAKYHPGWKWYVNGPPAYEYLRELKEEDLEPYKAVTVAEMPRVSDIDEIIKQWGKRMANCK